MRTTSAKTLQKHLALTFQPHQSCQKNLDKLVKEFHSSHSATSCKRCKQTSVYTDVKDALLKWFKHM